MCQISHSYIIYLSIYLSIYLFIDYGWVKKRRQDRFVRDYTQDIKNLIL